ncbi:MAG: SDR family oxidoreductase, partial [Fidelibacterota bacterium]
MTQKQPEKQVVLITGASSGIGKCTAEHLSRKGYKVYGTSRRPGSYPEPEHFFLMKADVRDELSVKMAVEEIIEKEQRIDILINNAGYGVGGAIENMDPEMVKAQFDTNFFGAFSVLHHVLPHMMKRGSGLIINMSSIGGLIGLPYQGVYSASKFALEGLTESLYKELLSSGIHVVLIEPGDFRTGFTASRELIVSKEGTDRFEESRKVIEKDEQSGRPPEKIA